MDKSSGAVLPRRRHASYNPEEMSDGRVTQNSQEHGMNHHEYHTFSPSFGSDGKIQVFASDSDTHTSGVVKENTPRAELTSGTWTTKHFSRTEKKDFSRGQMTVRPRAHVAGYTGFKPRWAPGPNALDVPETSPIVDGRRGIPKYSGFKPRAEKDAYAPGNHEMYETTNDSMAKRIAQRRLSKEPADKHQTEPRFASARSWSPRPPPMTGHEFDAGHHTHKLLNQSPTRGAVVH